MSILQLTRICPGGGASTSPWRILLIGALLLWGIGGCAIESLRIGMARDMLQAKPPATIHLKTWPQDGQITLRWTDLGRDTRYTLHWERDSGESLRRGWIPNLQGSKYLHRGLENGVVYRYRLIPHANTIGSNRRDQPVFPETWDVPYPYLEKSYPEFIAVQVRPHDTPALLAKRHLGNARQGWLIQEFNKLKTLTAFQVVAIPRRPPQPGGISQRTYRTVPVLVYHDINRAVPRPMSVPLHAFERQMAYLKREGYHSLTMSELDHFLNQGGAVPHKSVIISFDDGWRSNYELAFPVLRRLGLKGTLFLYSDFPGQSKNALNWKQIKHMYQSGVIDVQCHSKSHRDLRMHPDETPEAYLESLSLELSATSATIQEKLGKKCIALAYPYGAQNAVVTALAKKMGYRMAFTVRRGPIAIFSDPFRLRRSMIFGEYTQEQFIRNLRTQRFITR